MRHALFACFLSACAAAAVIAPAGAAHAADPAPPPVAPSDAAIAEARARFHEGVDLADQGKHTEALVKFRQAWAVFKSPLVLYNLARTEQLTGHDIEAFEHYREFIRTTTDPNITETMRERAKAFLAKVSGNIGQIELAVPTEAVVTVDGKEVDPESGPVPVQPGTHVVEAKLEGRTKTKSVACASGATVTVRIELDTGPGLVEPPPAGGGGGWSTGRIITVSALGAGAVAGGVLALVFHGQAQGAVDDAKALLHGGSCVGVTSPECTQAAGLKSDRDSAQTLTAVSLIAGGALAAGAIAAAVFWPSSSSSRAHGRERASAHFAPVVAPGYGGAALTGSF